MTDEHGKPERYLKVKKMLKQGSHQGQRNSHEEQLKRLLALYAEVPLRSAASV